MHYFHSPYTQELIQIEQMQRGIPGKSNWKAKHQRTGVRGWVKGKKRKEH
jgi:hypothetical protein